VPLEFSQILVELVYPAGGTGEVKVVRTAWWICRAVQPPTRIPQGHENLEDTDQVSWILMRTASIRSSRAGELFTTNPQFKQSKRSRFGYEGFVRLPSIATLQTGHDFGRGAVELTILRAVSGMHS
jgi:hypothetical protein